MPNDTSSPSKTPQEIEDEQIRSTVEDTFLLYAVFCGDPARVAAATNLTEDQVRQIAKDAEWDKKLKPIIQLKNSTKAGDVERAINRALNFVDAHRYRVFLARVLREMTGMSYSDLKAFLFPSVSEPGTGGLVKMKRFSTRSLADLASAIEKCQGMTYMALNDTATERRERPEEGEGADTSEMHLKLARAMTEASAGSMKDHLQQAQVAIAQEHAVADLDHGAKAKDEYFVGLGYPPRID